MLPWARRMLVEQRRWLTETEFNETLSLCQSLPGPNIVNVSIVTGSRFAGARGAVAALCGLVLAPMVIVTALVMAWSRFGTLPHLSNAVTAVGAAAAGLVVATAVRMATPLLKARPWLSTPFIAAAFVAVGLLRWPLPWVLAVLAPLSTFLVWPRRR